jgi:hypothetical protein
VQLRRTRYKSLLSNVPCRRNPGVQTVGSGIFRTIRGEFGILLPLAPSRPDTCHKEGARRSNKATCEHIFQQLVTSLEPNVVTKLVEAVRDSGIKDPVAQPIIDRLVKLGQALRKASPDRIAHTPDEVQAILTEELKKAYSNGPVMNPLLDMDGKWHGRLESSARSRSIL